MRTRFVVLLAGGLGRRLAPLSTPEFPKHFFRLPGEDESLLQQSARAACELVPAEQVITVTTAASARRVRAELREIAPELAQHVLVEESGMGTAASCAVAAHYAARITPKALLWVLPCDHDRRAPFSLRSLRESGFAHAESGHILTFGIRPSAPDTGYGYLVEGEGVVEHFHEKPDLLKAQELVDSGHAWWNSGMFVLPAAKLLGYLQHLAPELHSASSDAVHRGEAREKQLWLCGNAMQELEPLSLDKAVMERASGLKMHGLDAGWSDIGTWPRLLAWWQAHAADIPAWDFGNGEPQQYADLWQKMQQK